MNKQWLTPLLVAGGLVLAGCNSSSSSSSSGTDNDSDNGGAASVRVTHAVSDAPLVNILVNGDAALSSVDYRDSATLTPDAGSYEVAVQAQLPGGDTATVIGPVDLSFAADTRYDIIAVGSAGAETLEALVFESSPDYSSSTQARLYVAHLAPDAPEVDVYVSAFGAAVDFAATDPTLTFEFKDRTGPLEVDAGDYQIQVTAAGGTDVLFDSGEVSLSAGDDLFIGAIANTGANVDASPVSLLVLGGDEPLTVFDRNQQAGVRVVHATADAPAVDVFVGGAATAAISDLAFTETAPGQSGRDSYVGLDAGTLNVKVSAAGQSPDDAVIDADLDLVNGQGYTVLAVGLLDDIEPLVLADQTRGIATQASLRVIHASTQAPNVDVYLVDAGAGIGNSSPVLEDVPFKAASDFLPVAAGDYKVIVTAAGDGNPVIEVDDLSLEAGKVYTVIARDQDGGATFSQDVIVLDDFTE